MRKLLVTAAFAVSTASFAQQPAAPPEGSNWQHVQALPAGANIHVKARHSSASCKVKSVDADSLTCTGAKDLAFQRAEIKSITIPHHGRSTAIMAGVGAGAGAGIGAGTGNCKQASNCIGISRKDVALIVAVPGFVIGAVTGYFTDFTKSTVYKAP